MDLNELIALPGRPPNGLPDVLPDYVRMRFRTLASMQFSPLLAKLENDLKRDLVAECMPDDVFAVKKHLTPEARLGSLAQAGDKVRRALAELVIKAIVECNRLSTSEELSETIRVLEKWRRHHRTGFFLRGEAATAWLLGEYLGLNDTAQTTLLPPDSVLFGQVLKRVEAFRKKIADELCVLTQGCFSFERGIVSESLVALARDAFRFRLETPSDERLGICAALLGEFAWRMNAIRHQICLGLAGPSMTISTRVRKNAAMERDEYAARKTIALKSPDNDEREGILLLRVDAALPTGEIARLLGMKEDLVKDRIQSYETERLASSDSEPHT